MASDLWSKPPTDGKCPECGEPIATRPVTKETFVGRQMACTSCAWRMTVGRNAWGEKWDRGPILAGMNPLDFNVAAMLERATVMPEPLRPEGQSPPAPPTEGE